MVKRRQWSTATLMVVILFVASNCAFIRTVWVIDPIIVFMFLPMIDVLFFGFTRLGRRPHARNFWVGFEVVGWGMIGLLLGVCLFQDGLIIALLSWHGNHSRNPNSGMAGVVIFCTSLSVLFTTPPLVAATCAGWLAARYRLVIERRPPLHPDGLRPENVPQPDALVVMKS